MGFYRKRIDDLKECEREVKVLTATLKRNLVRKRKAKMKQAATIQELTDSRQEEERKGRILEEKLWQVQEMRRELDAEIDDFQGQLRAVCNQGDHDVNILRADIGALEDKIKNHQRHMEKTQKDLEHFDGEAREELAALNEELGKKEKERDIASASSDAAHRHLNNFAASMKSIEPDIAGGAAPQQRIVKQEQQRQAATAKPATPTAKTSGRAGAASKSLPKASSQGSRQRLGSAHSQGSEPVSPTASAKAYAKSAMPKATAPK